MHNLCLDLLERSHLFAKECRARQSANPCIHSHNRLFRNLVATLHASIPAFVVRKSRIIHSAHRCKLFDPWSCRIIRQPQHTDRLHIRWNRHGIRLYLRIDNLRLDKRTLRQRFDIRIQIHRRRRRHVGIRTRTRSIHSLGIPDCIGQSIEIKVSTGKFKPRYSEPFSCQGERLSSFCDKQSTFCTRQPLQEKSQTPIADSQSKAKNPQTQYQKNSAYWY